MDAVKKASPEELKKLGGNAAAQGLQLQAAFWCRNTRTTNADPRQSKSQSIRTTRTTNPDNDPPSVFAVSKELRVVTDRIVRCRHSIVY